MVARPSVPQEVTLLVQRVADGQASDRDLERYAALLESDPELAFEVEALQELSGTIREGLLEAGREAAGPDPRASQRRPCGSRDRRSRPRPARRWPGRPG